jgi:hypothetical protein
LLSLSQAEKSYQVAGIETVNFLQQSLAPSRNKSLAHFLEVILMIPSTRFSISTSTDTALINPSYPYFGIKFEVNE